MEGDKSNISTYPTPGTMSDVTLLSTPMPQAASTATKSRLTIKEDDEDDLEAQARDFLQQVQVSSMQSAVDRVNMHRMFDETNMKRLSALENSYKQTNGLQEEVNKVLDNICSRGTQEVVSGNNRDLDGSFTFGQIHQLSMLKQLEATGGLTKTSTAKENMKVDNNDKKVDDFDFRVPALPGKRNFGFNSENKVNSDIKKDTLSKKSADEVVRMTSLSKNSGSYNFSYRDSVDNASDNLGLFASRSKFRNMSDIRQHCEDRSSFVSSVNSSLGVIPTDVLDEVQRLPLVDMNKDLSIKLAEKLNLDSKSLKDGLDISALAGERYKERVAAKYEENKENQRTSSRNSSDYWTLHGYSSDNSDSRNNTAKRLSALSTGSGEIGKTSDKLFSSPRLSIRPLSEQNSSFAFSGRPSFSRSERSGVGSNPFGSHSNISVNSEDFQFEEDAMQRLDRDERQFSLASTRSLSGIYGDANASISVNGEKLSMSSFLRSGSGPLGSLEKEGNDARRPEFGLLTTSPEKTGKPPRPILPPPEERSTFLVEEDEPVRDTPWAPHSLMEQYSKIHCSDVMESDVSVPSLSFVSQMMGNVFEGANPREVLAKLMASQNKTKSNPDTQSLKPNKIASIVEGENSFCQGVNTASFSTRDRSCTRNLSYSISQDRSGSSSICNVTDFEDDEEACVCVLTLQSMDFDIFNELTHPVEYSFTKVCYVDGHRKDSAAYVNFPVSKLILFPGQKRTITINIAALVEGVIKIKIEVARKNPLTHAREVSNVYGKIVAELPRVVLDRYQDEMIPTPDCELVGKYHHTFAIKNEGRSTVPLKITVSKVTHDDVMFYFGEREKTSVTVGVEPGQIVRQLILCETPPVFAHRASPETIITVEARVDFRLATTDLYQLNPIEPVTLTAPLKPYFFGAPSRLTIPSNLILFNKCDHLVMFNTCTSSGYTVQTSQFTVVPHGTFGLPVNKADTKNLSRHGELTLQSLNPPGVYTVKLQEYCRSSLSSNNSLATPHGSRAASPTSPTSSKGYELKVACSYKELVWGGCHLHQKVIKTFCLKNNGHHREKLRLSISDKSTCFKIVTEEDRLQSELKLSLQPMENREIKVAVLATAEGPQWAHLIISRINCATDKNVLPLYAFGGKAKMNLADGIIEISQKQYLFLDEKNLQCSFLLSNTGDSSAFFKIKEASTKSSAGLSISPQESVLPPGCTATIHVTLSITAERLEYLLRQCAPSVCVGKLSICFGDESTRQRLLRMRGIDTALAERVALVSGVPACPIANLDKLDGLVNNAEALWHEDTDEWSVGVLIKRRALEALRLDLSVSLVDLSKTISKPH